MSSLRTQGLVSISFVFVILLMSVSPGFVSAQNPIGDLQNGPYVDKIVFNVIAEADQSIISLLNNEIDLIGGKVDPRYLEQLYETEDVEVVNTLRNGYGYCTINCAKNPFNYTSFRRALAFALDKEAISDDCWAGLSQPQDSCVTAVNPWSIEGHLPYTYYEANVALGNEILDAAGFDIDPATGFRTDPHGNPFDVLVECGHGSEIAMEVGVKIAEALNALNIDAVSVPTDFYEYLNRLNYHGDYDIIFLGATFGSFDVDWLAYEYWSEYADVPYFNSPNFRNASYDSWRDQLLHSTDYDEVYEAAIEMQRVWVYQCPEIICYENAFLSAYRTDKFEGFVNGVSGGIPGFWTNYKVHLKNSLGGPFGGTLRMSINYDINSFNLMLAGTVVSGSILGLLYDSLLTRDHNGNEIPWLAESWSSKTHNDNPDIPDGYTRFKFDLIQNATWTDGTPLTAEDVAFSLNYYRDSPGNPSGVDLSEMTAAVAPTTYQLVVEFNTESYWHLSNVAAKPIIPKHIFTEIGHDGWNSWNPNPPNDPMVTSGPFNVSEYIGGEFTEVTYNPNYFFGLDRTPNDTDTDTTTVPFNPIMAVAAGAVGAAVVILIGGYAILRKDSM